MKRITLDRTTEGWPPLDPLIGAEVVAVNRQPPDATLVLNLKGGTEVVIPSPWQFSSCLLAVSSSEFDADDGEVEDGSSLIGLTGARLTAIESDSGHLDLVFDSIRISVTARSDS